MIKEHYLFITIVAFFALLITGLTVSGLNGVTGYSVKEYKPSSCEPITCVERGLEPAGRYYCNEIKCYRDCIQDGVVIEGATFCEKQ